MKLIYPTSSIEPLVSMKIRDGYVRSNSQAMIESRFWPSALTLTQELDLEDQSTEFHGYDRRVIGGNQFYLIPLTLIS